MAWTTQQMLGRWQIGALFQIADIHKKTRAGDIARNNLLQFVQMLRAHGDAMQREQAKALEDLLDGKAEGSFNGTTYTPL